MNRYYFDKLARYKQLTKYKNELKYPRIYEIHKCIKELEHQAANPGIFTTQKWYKNNLTVCDNVDIDELAYIKPRDVKIEPHFEKMLNLAR